MSAMISIPDFDLILLPKPLPEPLPEFCRACLRVCTFEPTGEEYANGREVECLGCGDERVVPFSRETSAQ
jgi:hypothetical protein